MLAELTNAPDAALPVAQLGAHLRLGSGFDGAALQDALLAGFLRAALAAIEGRIGRVLYEREFRWTLARWRGVAAARLPVAPVTAVSAVTVIDAAGHETAVDPALWRLSPDGPPQSLCAIGAALPVIPEGGFARVEFLAGFGPEWEDIPPDLRQAVMLLAAHYYEYRAETALAAGCAPFGVTALLEPWRQIRLSLGARE